MVDGGDNTYGEAIVAVVRQIIAEVTMPLPVTVDDGDSTMVPFPETLVWGDGERQKLLATSEYADWKEHLPDLTKLMAKEGVLLVLSSLPQIGINVEDPLFGLMGDLIASFYTRGYMIGLLAGPDGVPNDERMEEYLTEVQEDIDRQVEEQQPYLEGLVDDYLDHRDNLGDDDDREI